MKQEKVIALQRKMIDEMREQINQLNTQLADALAENEKAKMTIIELKEVVENNNALTNDLYEEHVKNVRALSLAKEKYSAGLKELKMLQKKYRKEMTKYFNTLNKKLIP